MSLRNKINQYPVIPLLGVLIALSVCGYIVWDLISGGSPGSLPSSWIAYYSIDDGKTIFADKRPPSQPFQKDGKDAYLAIVYTCDRNKTTIVQALIKRTEETFTHPGSPEKLTRSVSYIKKPGDTTWVSEDNFGKWSAIERAPRCPDGSEAIMVTPAGMKLENVEQRPGKGAAKGAGKGAPKEVEAK